jgi:hypothetical protein
VRTAASPLVRQTALGLIIAVSVAGGLLVSGGQAAGPAADPELALVLRFMAALKALMAAAMASAILWRLQEPVSLPRFAFYGLASAAMSAGPGLIWTTAAIGWGAMLLHGGLVGAAVLLWRDPVIAQRLAALVRRRRQV